MAGDINLKVALTGASEARGQITGIEKAVQSATLKARILGDALVASTKTLARVSMDLIRDSVGAARAAQAANDSLNVSLRKLGTTYQTVAPNVERFATSMKRAFGFSDEDAKDGLTQLITSGMSLNEAMSQGNLIADIAAKRQSTLAESSKIVGLAFQGNTRALREFGIIIKTTGDRTKDAKAAFQALEQFQGEAAARAAREPWRAMNEEIGDIKEDIGSGFLPILNEAQKAAGRMAATLLDSGKIKDMSAAIGTLANDGVTALGGEIKKLDWDSIARGIDSTIDKIKDMTMELPLAIGKMNEWGIQLKKAGLSSQAWALRARIGAKMVAGKDYYQDEVGLEEISKESAGLDAQLGALRASSVQQSKSIAARQASRVPSRIAQDAVKGVASAAVGGGGDVAGGLMALANSQTAAMNNANHPNLVAQRAELAHAQQVAASYNKPNVRVQMSGFDKSSDMVMATAG
jgi:DNA-binding FrmR family transcriptional regulator